MKVQALLLMIGLILNHKWRGCGTVIADSGMEPLMGVGVWKFLDGSSKQMVRAKNVTAVMKSKPTNQPAGLVLHEMSFVVTNENLGRNVSEAIIECLSKVTSTKASNWGLFNTSKFGNKLIQAEYFGFVKTDKAFQFRNGITTYMQEKKLGGCVRGRYPLMKSNADVVYARKVIESLPNGTRSKGGVKAWIIGVVVGVLMLLGVGMSVTVMVKRTRVYDKVVFDGEAREELSSEERMVQDETRQLEAIAVGYY